MNEFRFCELPLFFASPTAAYSLPSGPNRSRPPLWYRFFASPVSTGSDVVPSTPFSYFIRTIRLSFAAVW